MKVTITLEAAKEYTLIDFMSALEPWINSNEDNSVIVIPVICAGYDSIELVIIRAKSQE